MKKLLLTLGATALILGLGACNNSKKAKSEDKSVPETTSKTASSDDVVSEASGGGEEGKIYCKMEYGWWTTDGAAIALYCWDSSPKVAWPGERMTPVEGQDHMWSIDYDGTAFPNLIFVRVSPSGDIADWGAKTKNLTAPTDGSNLYTITNSTECWGDPGCDGVWSTY